MARVVFFGSPHFALPTLAALVESGCAPALVVTQPDRPAGRGRTPRPTPVRSAAEDLGLPVEIVGSFRNGGGDRLLDLQPDFFVVAAFGLIFPERLLRIPRMGCVNVHASLLPAWRGASPVNAAIAAGDRWVGVTTMRMVRELDAGPIYLQRAIPVDAMESAGDLIGRLAELGGGLLVETLRGIEAGTLEARPQLEAGVSFAPRLGKQDGRIPWELDAIAVHDHVRGMNPWPGSFTYCRDRYVKVHRARLRDVIDYETPPGRVLEVSNRGVAVACGRGSVLLEKLQCEGKRCLDATEFLRGFEMCAGETLGGER
ncbi:MAG: methionyl-tRNA formyltransferase [Candidatus Krumholzibacteriota bacterium]|nr:methionyl-tRNA formyltransferase [Candidatus Krumholzibacteriota bacterium]